MNSKKLVKMFLPRPSFLKYTALAAFFFILPVMRAAAANFNIKPVKIFFDSRTRIEKLTLKNDSNDVLNLQLKAYQWTQDQTNKDVYQETKDLIIFPKIITLKKAEEKIVRIGTTRVPGAAEKSYRVYVTELPSMEKEESQGSRIRMLLKIGVPVFISPIAKKPAGTIDMTELAGGKIKFKVTNTGDLHFIVTGIQVKGIDHLDKDLFSTELGGWYLLSGSSKTYQTNLPDEFCRDTARLDILVRTNIPKLTFEENFPVKKAMCGPSKEAGKKDGS
jgi:fimbrial chaperone protein